MATPTSLAQALIWTELKDFYAREGVAAWDQQVPFYATSNPYLADAYAAIL